ncbi:lipopolysaccharide biosynthesis protein [Legionella sp. km772]|uniref:lipopolysaccharide biosynthesis protein n=1 Tax=Legionella sp. km772 TaxID=2498111 RepID=UPI000F8E14D1|nr:lipopolysaccharide biosynthesis protein [Legionella sp. km772]RUR12109.1 lipopolysaccharide biosynthesis protein [Legionella sp. km772]
MNKILSSGLKKHLTKFGGFATASLGGVFFSYLATYFINKHLNMEEMGCYSYVFSLLNFIYPVVSLSIFNGYTRFIDLYPNDLLISFVKKISFLTTFFFLLIIILFFGNYYYLPFAFIILYQERLILARAQLELRHYNFLNIIQKIVFLILLLGVYLFKHSLSAEISLGCLGASYLTSYLMVFARRNKYQAQQAVKSAKLDKEVFLKFCLYTMITMVVNWVLAVSDQVIIKFYYGFEALAPYAVAYRIVTMLGLLSGIFLAYYPRIYFKNMEVKDTREIFVLRNCFILLLFLTTILLWVFKSTVYKLFGATSYLEHDSYFLPLLLGEMLRTLASVMMTFLTFRLKQINILITTLLIAMLNLVLNLLFVPSLGPIASAYCTLACFTLYLMCAFIISYLPETRYLSRVTS